MLFAIGCPDGHSYPHHLSPSSPSPRHTHFLAPAFTTMRTHSHLSMSSRVGGVAGPHYHDVHVQTAVPLDLCAGRCGHRECQSRMHCSMMMHVDCPRHFVAHSVYFEAIADMRVPRRPSAGPSREAGRHARARLYWLLSLVRQSWGRNQRTKEENAFQLSEYFHIIWFKVHV